MGRQLTMSNNVTTVAPTNAPTAAPSKSAMWEKHWRSYNDPRPVPYKGKIAWAVTQPKELLKKLTEIKNFHQVLVIQRWQKGLSGRLLQKFINGLIISSKS